jgi:hypothetical protein
MAQLYFHALDFAGLRLEKGAGKSKYLIDRIPTPWLFWLKVRAHGKKEFNEK